MDGEIVRRPRWALPFSYRRCEGSVAGPSPTDTCADSVCGKAGSLCPFRDGQRFLVVGEQATGFTVSCLLCCRCPSHVAGFIVAIIVDPIQRMLGRRRRSCVGKERDERCSPLLTDFDSPAPIARVRIGAWAVTSTDHPIPRSVFLRTVHPMPAREGSFPAGLFSSKATATLGHSLDERASVNDVRVSAIALAKPMSTRSPIRVIGVIDDDKSAKASSGQDKTPAVVAHDKAPLRRASLVGWGSGQRTRFVGALARRAQAPRNGNAIIPERRAV